MICPKCLIPSEECFCPKKKEKDNLLLGDVFADEYSF